MRIVFFFCSFLLTSSLWAQNRSKTVITNNPFATETGTEKTFLEIFKAHKGKVIYVDFWASWCGPCRREMPASKTLHEKLKGEDVVFVYISIDERKGDWIKSMNALGIKDLGENYHRAGSQMKDFLNFFNLRSIPRYMIIDKEGQIYESDAAPPSYPEAEKTLRKLLKAKTTTTKDKAVSKG